MLAGSGLSDATLHSLSSKLHPLVFQKEQLLTQRLYERSCQAYDSENYNWKVDLAKYDMQVVLLMIEPR
jgi:hypothetical protein